MESGDACGGAGEGDGSRQRGSKIKALGKTEREQPKKEKKTKRRVIHFRRKKAINYGKCCRDMTP